MQGTGAGRVSRALNASLRTCRKLLLQTQSSRSLNSDHKVAVHAAFNRQGQDSVVVDRAVDGSMT